MIQNIKERKLMKLPSLKINLAIGNKEVINGREMKDIRVLAKVNSILR
jgi:hypothetical protein